MLQKAGDPFQGPQSGSCLAIGNELSKETCADKARDVIGRGAQAESRRVREPRRTALPWGSQAQVL